MISSIAHCLCLSKTIHCFCCLCCHSWDQSNEFLMIACNRPNWKMIGCSNYWKVKTCERVQLGRTEKHTHIHSHTSLLVLLVCSNYCLLFLIAFILNYPFVFKIIINTPRVRVHATYRSCDIIHAWECVCLVSFFCCIYTGVWIIAWNRAREVNCMHTPLRTIMFTILSIQNTYDRLRYMRVCAFSVYLPASYTIGSEHKPIKCCGLSNLLPRVRATPRHIRICSAA